MIEEEKRREIDGERRKATKGPFTNDVSRQGKGGGYPDSDIVREVA